MGPPMFDSGRVRPTYFRGVIMFIPSWLRSLARTLGVRRGSSRPARRPAARNRRPARRSLRLDPLEDRVVPSITSTFELDGNVTSGSLIGSTTGGSTTTSYDWNQVYKDNVINHKTTNTSGSFDTFFATDATQYDTTTSTLVENTFAS